MYASLMRHFLGDVDRIVALLLNYVATNSPILQRYLAKVSVISFSLDRASYPPKDKARSAYYLIVLIGVGPMEAELKKSAAPNWG